MQLKGGGVSPNTLILCLLQKVAPSGPQIIHVSHSSSALALAVPLIPANWVVLPRLQTALINCSHYQLIFKFPFILMQNFPLEPELQ